MTSTSPAGTSASAAETHTFQAEVAELLHLMVHSVYSETEIFLRELISNASDACDKLRYEAISAPALMGEDARLAIRIGSDAAAGTLTISDNGIGMDRQELIDNLGTIARSGTRAFLSKLAEARDGGGLIGQFGVGFYSAFMVADRIEVTSRRAGSDGAWVWRSDSGAGFEIAPADEEQSAQVPRGTSIRLHLKADARRFLERHTIERIVRTYSDNIQFPIELVEAAGEARQINTASAVWQRSKSELGPEDYKQAYLTISGGFDEPAMTLHYRAEGRQSYAVLLFAPSTPPFDLYDPARKGRVRLYVRRVFITDDNELMPPYLRFMRGVIDSEDLPLNISREMLQNNLQLAAMRKAITSRVLSELESLSEKDKDAFTKLWDVFGSVLKEGIYEDPERRDQILRLARFTTTTGTEPRSLADVVRDMRPNQQAIYYLVGDNRDRLAANPKLEAARARGIEVLLLTDHVDAFWTSMPIEFQTKALRSLSQGDVDFGDVPLAQPTGEETTTPPGDAIDDVVVIASVKAALGDKVADVKASQRLTDSPACLIAGGSGPDRELERLLSRASRGVGAKPVLELNMRHPLLKALADARAGGNDEDVSDLASLLMEEAQILDGEMPDDPAGFARRVNRLVARGLGRAAT